MHARTFSKRSFFIRQTKVFVMKGISSIIVAILLLMISISMVSFGYVFLSGTLSDTTESVEELGEQSSTTLLSKMRIDSVIDDEVYLRNTGKVNVSQFSVFVNDVPDNGAISNKFSIAPGDTATIKLSSDPNVGDVIKVTNAQGSFAIAYVRAPEGQTCPDGFCDDSVNENCPADAGACPDNPCQEPTCISGCGQIFVPYGQNDESCNDDSDCVGSDCACDGAGVCISFSCGNGACDVADGECTDCPGDCSVAECCTDFNPSGDPACNGDVGEDNSNCPTDCPPSCGNLACDVIGGECTDCPGDCSVAECCGNSFCDDAVGEDPGNCLFDCPPVCPDGICSTGETCEGDDSACPEPAKCYLSDCLNGCNALGGTTSETMASGLQDNSGSYRCNDVTGCTSPPCECDGSGNCISKCGNGICSASENCPADAGACAEPPKCYLKSCTNGCNSPATAVAAGSLDNEGSDLCNGITGCTSPPCECDGAGACISSIPPGIVGLWHLDGDTTDSSGYGNDGTGFSATWVSSIISGQALNFDGFNDYLRIADDNSLDATNEITIAAWIKLVNFGQNGYGRIVDKNSDAAYAFYVRDSNPNGLSFRVDGTPYYSSPNIITTNVWQYVAVTFNSNAPSNQIKFYVNGVPSGTATRTAPIPTTFSDLYIGNNPSLTGDFNGIIDEVKIWNEELTAAEIDQEYQSSKPSTELVGFWNFDEGTGSDGSPLHDYSGNGYDGTLIGVDAGDWVASKPGWGTTIQFNGIDEYIDLPSFDVSGNQITIMAWFYIINFGSGSAVDQRIISKATDTTEAGHWWMLSTHDINYDLPPQLYVLRFRLKTGTTTTTLRDGGSEDTIATTGALSTYTWTHAAAVYDGNYMMIYKDGTLVARTAKTGSIATSSAVDVNMARNPAETTYGYLSGRIDDVRIYNRALTQAEIQAAMADPNP